MISNISREFFIGISAGSALLILLLLGRMLAQKSASRKFYFFLFLLLYSGSLLTLFSKETPAALSYYHLGLLCISLLFFTLEAVGEWLRAKSAPAAVSELKHRRGPLFEVVEACKLISEAKLGALFILERRNQLLNWAAKGVRLDATVSREILVSIFTPPGALHDGAVLISRDRIVCAGLIVPLSKNPNLSKELGTRHRAAIGFSEVTDALCLIISEETGAVSLADRGRLFYDVPQDKLPQILEHACRFKMGRAKSAALYTEPNREPLFAGKK